MTAYSDPPQKKILARCFLSAAAVSCVGGATSWMQPVLMHDLVLQKGLNEAQAGGLLTVEGVAMGVASMILAGIIKRERAQFYALVGVTLAILSSLLTFMTDNVLILFASRFFVGCGVGGTIMISNIVAANFPDPDKTYAQLGVVNLAYGAIAVALYTYLLRLFPAATPYHFIALTFVVCLPIMFALPKLSKFDRAAGRITEMQSSISAEGTHKRTIILALVTFSVTLASGIMWALYALIGEKAGLSFGQINGAIAMAISTGFVGVMLPAVLGSRFGRILPFLLALTVLTIAVMVLASYPSAYLYRIAVCANVAAVYFLLPYMSGAAARIDGGGNAAAYVSSVFFFANSLAPLVAGTLITTIGITVLTSLIVVIAIFAVIGFVYVERVSDRIERQRTTDPSSGQSPLHDALVMPSSM